MVVSFFWLLFSPWCFWSKNISCTTTYHYSWLLAVLHLLATSASIIKQLKLIREVIQLYSELDSSLLPKVSRLLKWSLKRRFLVIIKSTHSTSSAGKASGAAASGPFYWHSSNISHVLLMDFAVTMVKLKTLYLLSSKWNLTSSLFRSLWLASSSLLSSTGQELPLPSTAQPLQESLWLTRSLSSFGFTHWSPNKNNFSLVSFSPSSCSF